VVAYYPPEALRLKEQGVVVQAILVEADGTVSQYAFIQSSGSPRIDDGARAFVRALRYSTPGKIDGIPTRMFTTVTVTFKLK
jgi:TonB family protein